MILKKRLNAFNLFVVSVFVLTLVVGYFVDRFVQNEVFTEAESHWLTTVETAAASINPERIKTLDSIVLDETSPDYQRLLKQLKLESQVISRENLKPFYLMIKKGEDIFIEVDASEADSDYYAPPGTEYSEAPAELLSLFEASDSVLVGPYSDRWGTFVSVFSSIRDSETGQPLAVLGADVPFKYIQDLQNYWRLGTLLILLLVLFFEVSLFYYLLRRKIFISKIEENETLLRNIIEIGPDVAFQLKESGEVVFVSRSLVNLVGIEPQKLVGKKLVDLFVPVKQKKISQAFQELNSGAIKKIIIESQVVTAGKQKKFVEVYLKNLMFNGELQIHGLIRDVDEYYKNNEEIKKHAEESAVSQKATLNILEDVEEEKRRSEALAADLEKFKLAVDNASDHIVITDVEGIVLYGNAAMERITGYTVAESMGKKAGVLWRLPMPTEYYKKMWDTIKNKKQVFINDIRNRRKNGEEYDARISISPVLDKDKKVTFFVGIERDITKEKEIDRAKTEFVSLASHQLRTPLSAINWYVEMLMNGDAGKLNKEQKQYLEEVYKGNHRMVDLVNALLNVSRLELGTFMVEPKKCDIIEIANSVIEELAPQIKSRHQILNAKYDKNLPLILLDEKLTRIIFQNLLSNSVKYTPEKGKIGLVISKNARQIEIVVSDSGMGIPKSQQDKIFTKLFRADNVRATDTEGTGLGLYIIKSIVDQVGGSIKFKSEENKGTIFTVALPLKGMVKKEGSKSLT